MKSAWKGKTALFLLSQGVTLFGSSLVQFAIVWYVTLNTSSGVLVSALTICSFVPQFIISFFSGVWADRYSRKALIIAADGVIAAATLALALMLPHIGDGDGLIVALMAVSVVRSLGAGVQTPAVGAVLPQLVPSEHLMRLNGMNATIQSAVQFAAPAAAGAILTFSTLRQTLLIDIATAAVGIGLLSLVTIPRRPPEAEAADSSIFADMKLGMRYAFSNRFIGRLLASYGVFIFLAVPAGFLAALFVSRTYGDSYFNMSLVEIIGFAGMAAGGVIISAWGGFKERVKTLIVGVICFGALAVGMGAADSFAVYLVMMTVYGIALTAVQTAVTTLIQERAEPDMQGRVFGFLGAVYSGALPIGMAVFGPLADVMSMRLMMILSGVLMLVLALWLNFRLPRSAQPDGKSAAEDTNA